MGDGYAESLIGTPRSFNRLLPFLAEWGGRKTASAVDDERGKQQAQRTAKVDGSADDDKVEEGDALRTRSTTGCAIGHASGSSLTEKVRNCVRRHSGGNVRELGYYVRIPGVYVL